MPRWRIELLIIAGLFIVPLLFFAPVTFGGRTLIPADNLYQDEPWKSYREEAGAPEVPHNALLSDLVLQNYQWKSFIRHNINDGEIPLWQPNQFTGSTFLANGQHSLLYPFSVIYYILPLESAFGWFTVSQLWLAGLLMYLYVRGIRLSRIAGLVAALTVQLSSFFIVATVHPMIQAGAAWLPFQLLMIEFLIQQRPLWRGKPARLPWLLFGALGLGMVHLAGHLEITYYTLLVMGFYSAGRLLAESRHQSWRALLSPAFMLIGMVILGFGVGAVQFIPGVEAANNSFRTEREQSTLSQVRSYALPNRHVAKFLIPNIFGNPAHHQYTDVFTGQTITHDWLRPDPAAPDRPTRVTNTDFGIKNYVEGGAYIGILPLFLALYGLYAGLLVWRNPPSDQPTAPPIRLIFFVLLLIAALFAFGTPFYAILYYGLPGVDQLHTPFRWLWVITVCLALFAAYGADALYQSRGEQRYGPTYYHAEPSQQPLYKIAKRGGWLLIYGGAFILVLLILTRLFYDQFGDSLISRIYQNLAGAQNAFPDSRTFYSYQFRNVLLFALMIIGAGVVFRVSRCPIYVGKGERRFPIWQLLAVIIITLDLFAATFDFNPAAKREWLAYTPPPLQVLTDEMQTQMAQGQPFRVYAYEWDSRVLNANSGWRYNLHDLRGYDSLFSKDYAQLMGQITPQGGLDFNRIDPIPYYNATALDNPLLDMLNVRYIITDWLIMDAEAMGYQRIYADSRDSVQIYQNLEAYPRAYTVPLPANAESYAPYERCLQSLFGDPPPVNPADLAYIPPLSGACIPITPATITRYTNREVVIDTVLPEESWLILSDSYESGWKAYLKPKGASQDQESELDIVQVNGNLRGVKLPSGEWTIRFRYTPATFQIGAFLSFISLMLITFMTLLWLWNTFVAPEADTDDSRRLIKNSLAPISLNLFNRGIDFAFAFIMLRILGPSDAGIYYYAIVVFGWFDILTNFGLNTLLTREVSRNKDSAGTYLLNTSLLRLALGLMALPVLGGVLLFRNATVTPALDSTAVIAILLLYLGLIPNSISTGLTALFYAFEKAEYPAAISTITTLVKVTAGLGVLLLGWGVIGLAAASILTNLVTFIILTRLAYPLLKATRRPIPDGKLQRTMLREAYPLMINHLLATVFFKSDVILMEAINGVAVVGVYSTAYKWLDALNIIPAFFTMALLPIMSRQAHDDRTGLRRNYLFSIKLLWITALFVAVVTTFIAHALVGLLGGAEFLPDGAIALQIMIWSIPIGWMNSLTQYVLIALDRQRHITGAFIVAVSFNIIGNLIFLPLYSYRAAAVTTILSELILFIAFFWLIVGSLGMINWLYLLWKPALASFIVLLVFLLLWDIFPLIPVLLSPFLYLLLLTVLRPFTPDETQRLKRLVPAPLRHRLPQKT